MSNINFHLSEIGVKKYFDKLESIAESRQSEYVKKELTFIAAILKRDFVEYDQREQLHLQRIEGYKKELKQKQDFIYYLCKYYGLDYQLEMTCYLANETAKKTLERYGMFENPKTKAA